MAQRRREKSAGCGRFRGRRGESALKPGFDTDVFRKASALHGLRSDSCMADFILRTGRYRVSLSVLMAVAWVVQQRTGNSGWVDTIWTFALGLIGAGARCGRWRARRLTRGNG